MGKTVTTRVTRKGIYMPQRKSEPRERLRLRKQRSRTRQKLTRLRKDWVRVDLERYYDESCVPAQTWVLAETFFAESELVQQLLSKELFLSTTLRNAGRNFIGIEAQQVHINGEALWMVRPKE
jgi:hypothetical protein